MGFVTKNTTSLIFASPRANICFTLGVWLKFVGQVISALCAISSFIPIGGIAGVLEIQMMRLKINYGLVHLYIFHTNQFLVHCNRSLVYAKHGKNVSQTFYLTYTI